MQDELVKIWRDGIGAKCRYNSPASYDVSSGLDKDVVIKTVKELLAVVKLNGLTVRHAQEIFEVCKDCVLDSLSD